MDTEECYSYSTNFKMDNPFKNNLKFIKKCEGRVNTIVIKV